MISDSELPVTLFDRVYSVSVNVKFPASESFNQTSDEIRRAQLKIMKLGLVSYMVKKGYTNQLSLNFSGTTEAV